MARILLVDDSAFMRRQLQRALARLNHETREAESGQQGLQALLDYKPEIVITDLLMPHMDGFEFIELVRGLDDDLSRVPIIVLSADIQTASRRRTRELGAQHFLNKPVELAMLRATLEELAARNEVAL